MIHRVISFSVPDFAIHHAQECGCIVRSWDTLYRGPIAFAGGKRAVWRDFAAR